MNFRTPGRFLPLLFLAACAQMPGKSAVVAGKPAPRASAGVTSLPNRDLTPPLLFDFLLGETALQRGDQDVATRTYLKLAQETRDPRVAQRATEIALHSRLAAPAFEAAKLWTELDPDSVPARQAIAALLVNTGRLDEARPYLEQLLASEGTKVDEAFMQLNNLLGRNPNKYAVFELVRQLAQPYEALPEAHFALSQAAWFASDFDTALSEMKQALALRPEWEAAAIYQGRILARTSHVDAMDFYKSYLDSYPRANDTRLTYARLLLMEKKYGEAREQFERLLAENPGNAEVALAVGLLSMELREYDIAESNFKKALELEYKDPGLIRFHIGGIYEKTQRFDEAMEWYRSVTDGTQYIPAQVRYAMLLTKQGKMEEAREHLHKLPVATEQQRAQLIIAEAQLLRETGAHRKVYELLSNGLKQLPDHVDLLYDRALAAEKIGKPDIMEKDLRKLIQLKPDHAHAYNALGYGLVERNDRLPEALELIEKAVTLSPNDPYIMDSLGWAHYRMGNLNQGLSYLRQAFGMNPDPEIAAHLGEVLWVQGIEDEAREVWKNSLENNPGNETLIGTMKKFMK